VGSNLVVITWNLKAMLQLNYQTLWRFTEWLVMEILRFTANVILLKKSP